jgi:hypothetical protein
MATRNVIGAWPATLAMTLGLGACSVAESSVREQGSAVDGASGAGAPTNTGVGGGAGAGTGGGAGVIDAGPSLDARREASVRDVFVADRPPGAQGIFVRVVNTCPFDLWLRAVGRERVLEPDDARLSSGAAQDYIAPDPWTAARITAHLSPPPADEIDKVEITISAGAINYNITYVDWLGLPAEMVALGSGVDCKRVGCYVPEREVLTGCPGGLLSGKKCLSAGNYCSSPNNQAKPYCLALDAKIGQCAGDPKYAGCAGAAGATTPQAYACSGFFGGTPKWCAALNRGMIDDPESKNAALYYLTAPFNTYASWVHTACPGIYAFPYDDYGNPNESGFHSCTGGTQLNVTFCPEG